MRHTKKQRELLYKAWNCGYLNDSKNYGAISEVTGLSRKQVSNWARYQIKKLGNNALPKRSKTPLRSTFKDLPKVKEQNSYSSIQSIPPLGKRSNFPLNIPSQQKPMKQETAAFLSAVAQSMSSLPGFPLKEPAIPTKPIAFEETVRTWLPMEPPLTAHPKFGYTQPSRLSHPVANHEDHQLMPSSFPNRLSPINQWVLLNAIKNLQELDDAGVEDLERLTSSRSIDISCYLLSHGWKAKPNVRGIRYIRI